MKTVRNLTQKPLAVPLPSSRVLHLGPGKTGEISAHASVHPPLVALVTAGELEIGEAGQHPSGPTPTGGARHGTTSGFRPGTKSSRRGDR